MKIETDLRKIQIKVHKIACEKGWHSIEFPSSFGDQIANMHSELSEAWEGYRTGSKPSDKIPDYTSVEEELADTIIRILDTAQYRGLRVIEAIDAKMKFNKTREFRHGGKLV